MPLPKKTRVEAVPDPLARQPKTGAAAPGPSTAKERVREQLEGQKPHHHHHKPAPKRPARRDHYGALFDPSMKQVACAHAGAGRAMGSSLFGGSVHSGPKRESGDLEAMLAALRGTGGEAAASVEAAADVVRTTSQLEETTDHWPDRFPRSNVPVDLFSDGVPDVEPWDEPYLVVPSYAALDVDEARLSNLVHHIPPVVGWNPTPDVPPMKLVKTKAEQKKETHIHRVKKAEQEQQDRALGLAPKQPQRLTLKHLRNPALLAKAGGPTELEDDIRAQVTARVLGHYQTNEERHRAAAEHQKQHHHDRLLRLASERPRMVVYRVDGIHQEHLLTKIKITAKERLLRGRIYWVEGQAALIVLVGGEQPMRRVLTVIRNAEWPSGTVVVPLWVSQLSGPAAEALFPFEELTSKEGTFSEGGRMRESVRLFIALRAKEALHDLKSHGVEWIWDAACRFLPQVEG